MHAGVPTIPFGGGFQFSDFSNIQLVLQELADTMEKMDLMHLAILRVSL